MRSERESSRRGPGASNPSGSEYGARTLAHRYRAGDRAGRRAERRPARAQGDFTAGHAHGDGVRLAWQAGAGPLIVFLHGHPDDWTLYTAQLREFSRDHLVVAPNLRGYPPSEAPAAVDAYTMPHLLNDVHGLLDHVGRERCVLVGNDWGLRRLASPRRTRTGRALVILNAPHPAVHLHHVRTDPAQNHTSQYERDYNTAPPAVSRVV